MSQNCTVNCTGGGGGGDAVLGFAISPVIVSIVFTILICIMSWIASRLLKKSEADVTAVNTQLLKNKNEETTPLVVNSSSGTLEAPSSKDAWAVYNTPSAKRSCDWKSVVLTFFTVIGAALQNGSLNFWLLSFGAPFPWSSASSSAYASPYFVLLYACFFFTIIFGIWALIQRRIAPKAPLPSLRVWWFNWLCVGALTGLNGFLVVFASPPNRCPPLMQGILPNTGILWAILFTRLIVGKRNNPIPLLKWQPILAISGVLVGTAVSFSPLIIEIAQGGSVLAGQTPVYALEWSLVFLVGFIPGTVLNVFQEAYLKGRKRECENSAETRSKMLDYVVGLFWSTGVFQFLTVILLWWFQLIPGFGLGPQQTAGEFWSDLGETIACFFNQRANCSLAGPLSLLFMGGFLLNTLTSLGLNESSAVFNTIATTLNSPMVTLFFVIFPSLNFGAAFPLWSVLPSLAILIAR